MIFKIKNRGLRFLAGLALTAGVLGGLGYLVSALCELFGVPLVVLLACSVLLAVLLVAAYMLGRVPGRNPILAVLAGLGFLLSTLAIVVVVMGISLGVLYGLGWLMSLLLLPLYSYGVSDLIGFGAVGAIILGMLLAVGHWAGNRFFDP